MKLSTKENAAPLEIGVTRAARIEEVSAKYQVPACPEVAKRGSPTLRSESVPVGWSIRKVSDTGDVLTGKALAVNAPGPQRPYLRTKNVLDGAIDIDDVLTMVRIHSACLTGDVFGSRRCDCGDQLRLALARLHEAGGGIILYLAQGGRGLGLANKIRTYEFQDAGLDTVDATTTLGFDDDERHYGVAVRMLQMLGATRIMLLTNNPDKLDSLARAGIEISGRIPLETPVNADTRRYLTAKAARAGHHLGHVIAALSEPPQSLKNPVPLES